MPSAYISATEDVTLYLKPGLEGVVLVDSPWTSDDVSGTWNASKQRYEFTVVDGVEYLVFELLGATPASSDLFVGELLEVGTETQQIINGVLSGLSSIEPKVVSNYDQRKRFITITAGNDLSEDNGTQVDVPVNLPAGMDGETCTARFGAKKIDDADQAIQADASLVELASVWYVRIQLTSEESSVDPGDYTWDALVVDADSLKTTVVRGRMEVAEPYAEAS